MQFSIILLTLITTHVYSQLIFQDEFENTNALDENKWVIENELETCTDKLYKQLNCYTNSKKNVRLINGTVAITAIRENYLNKEYTSSIIKTKDSFTFGKFDIRAALPSGKLLRPFISLTPTVKSNDWPSDGEIVILTNTQKKIIEYGIFFTIRDGSGRVEPKKVGEKFSISSNLNDFHTYTLEWNEKELVFYFDGIKLGIIDFFKELRGNSNPFLKPFSLSMGLSVGGVLFENKVLTEEEVKEWKCSSLIVDYVKVNKLKGGRSGKQDKKIKDLDRKSSAEICNSIMKEIGAGLDSVTTQTTFDSTTELITEVTTTEAQVLPIVSSSTDSPINTTNEIVLGHVHIDRKILNGGLKIDEHPIIYLCTLSLLIALNI